MSDPLDPAPSPPAKEDPEALVLRGKPRPAVRFRRGLIVGTTGAVAAVLVTLSWLALQPPSFRKAQDMAETETSAKDGAEALADVPGSYGDVPRLGPPLPGDLGRPILEQQRNLAGPPLDTSGAPARRGDGEASAARGELERLAAARQAARISPVMVQLAAGGSAVPRPASSEGAPVTTVAPEPAPASAAVPPGQQHKIEFARGAGAAATDSDAASQWTLAAGTLIPASLITGLDSDLPGMVLAQVTQNVRDSATGRTILVPQGARLVGKYDSAVAYGQRRALLVWTEIVMPDGSSVRLDNMPATDSAGYSGIADRVDSRTWQLAKGIALSTLLGVGTELGLGSGESAIVRAIRESAQQNSARAGDQITSRNLEVQPTIRVRPGWPVRAIVNRALVLQPWPDQVAR